MARQRAGHSRPASAWLGRGAGVGATPAAGRQWWRRGSVATDRRGARRQQRGRDRGVVTRRPRRGGRRRGRADRRRWPADRRRGDRRAVARGGGQKANVRRPVDCCRLAAGAKQPRTRLGVSVQLPHGIVDGGMEKPVHLQRKVHAIRTLVHDEPLQRRRIPRVVDEQVAQLGEERLQVRIRQMVQLVAQVVVDASGVAVAVQVGDGHPGVEKLRPEQPQQPAH